MHPGYGFLAENADFAEAVIAAGITWIGPSPDAIRKLGDKAEARHIASGSARRWRPARPTRSAGAEEVIAFADEYGLPVAIKAAFGGGGRGLKVARDARRDPRALRLGDPRGGRRVRTGRVLRRAVPRQAASRRDPVLADAHGNVVVVSTRDCSLQRRHQKLVEEAPAPFLSEQQIKSLYDASEGDLQGSRLRRRGHVRVPGRPGRHDLASSRSTPGCRSSIRSPKRSPASTWCASSSGSPRARSSTSSDPVPHGHAFEFRINGEDAGRGFLPAPGRSPRSRPPVGPGVRVDTGVEPGSVIGGAFDSLLAKLIVTGAVRDEALERSRRALDEFVVDGMPDRAAVPPGGRARPGLRPGRSAQPFTIYTRWIETEFDNDIPAVHRRRRGRRSGRRARHASSSRSAASGSRSRFLPGSAPAVAAAAAEARPKRAAGNGPARGLRGRAHQRRCRGPS